MRSNGRANGPQPRRPIDAVEIIDTSNAKLRFGLQLTRCSVRQRLQSRSLPTDVTVEIHALSCNSRGVFVHHVTVRWTAVALTIQLLVACARSEAPATPVGPYAPVSTTQGLAGPPVVPAWVTDPEALPPGLRGRNNCTFAFGQTIPQWDFHPDAGCWERPGPDGWTRQQQFKLHVPQLAACGGGAGDVSPVRVCREPDQTNPCPINPRTGPTGCALCVRNVTCH